MQVKEASLALRKAVMYQINLRVFTQEGTLRSAERHLDDVASTGADIVYLCPVVLSDDDGDRSLWSSRQRRSGCDNPRNPYRVKDYFTIDPEYGSADDLRSFVCRAHELKLKVMLDLVYLHAGPTFGRLHPQLVQRDASGNPQLNSYNFCTLDFGNDELRDYLWRNMLYFVEEFGVDGYRTDCGGDIPLDFWEEGARRLRRLRPDFILLDECDVIYRPEDQREAFDVNYSQWWLSISMRDILAYGAPACSLELTWRREHECCPGGLCIRGLEHHDTANDMYENRIERFGHARCEAAYVLNYCMDGVPFLYNGCEYQDVSRHSIFGRPGQFFIDRSRDPSPRFAFFRRLAELHRSEPALLHGETRWLEHNCPDSVVALVRETREESLLCVVNLGRGPVSVLGPELGSWSSCEVLLERGRMPVTSGIGLSENGYLVCRRSSSL